MEEAERFARLHANVVVGVHELSAAEGTDDVKNCIHRFISNILKTSKTRMNFGGRLFKYYVSKLNS